MTKRRVAIFCLLLAIGSSLRADTTTASAPTNDPPKLWFPVGEELVYVVKWGYIPVAKTRVVSRWVQHEGRRLLAIRYRTRSNRVIAKLYPVDDTIEALIEPDTFRPVRFIKNLTEGRHYRYELTTFDYEAGIARWYAPDERKMGMYAITKDTRDLVSFMFHLRRTPFLANRTTKHRLMADNKIYGLSLKAEDHEKVKLSGYGKVRSLKMEPIAEFQGLFVRKGRMWLWVSDDSRRVITKIQAEVPVANVNIYLCGIHGPGDDAWVRNSSKKECDNDPDVDAALKELDSETVLPEHDAFIW